jgi:hypothetical protein
VVKPPPAPVEEEQPPSFARGVTMV